MKTFTVYNEIWNLEVCHALYNCFQHTSNPQHLNEVAAAVVVLLVVVVIVEAVVVRSLNVIIVHPCISSAEYCIYNTVVRVA